MYKFVKYKMQEKRVIEYIVNWLLKYQEESRTDGFVIGISGGVDSAVTSTLAAMTRLPVLCLEMPIHQNQLQIDRGKKHIECIKRRFNNVENKEVNLNNVFDNFVQDVADHEKKNNQLALANARARIRMSTLYYYAQINNFLVLGTGNKVEDFGIGFFTKYGDGGVDISPIADLLKTEVYVLAKHLKINDDILSADPTDGLWDNERTDESQIGATYPEIELAMKNHEDENILPERQKEVLKIYKRLNIRNQHKMRPIPVCKIPENIK